MSTCKRPDVMSDNRADPYDLMYEVKYVFTLFPNI